MIIFFSLLLSFFPIQEALSDETEAYFPEVCLHCDSKDPKYQLIKEKQDCLKTISQEKCQNIPIEDRKNCKETDNFKITDTSSMLYQCVENTLSSYKFIFDFLWYIIQSSKSWLFEDNNQANHSSAKNYILTEFYRAYRSSEGNRLQRLLKAASIVGGDQFNLFWSSLKSFIHKEVGSFKCYKSSIQISIGCSLVLGYVLPGSPGISMILKKGVKTGKNFIKHSRKAALTLTQKRNLNTLIKDLEIGFHNLKQTTLKTAKNLRQREQKEIKSFFDKVNKNQFLSELKATLNKKVESGVKLNRQQIRLAVTSSLTAINVASSLKLSAKSTAAISQGVANNLATKYVDQNIISKE